MNEQSNAAMKRKLHEPVSYYKKLRSKVPRRKRRFQISPVIGEFSRSLFGDDNLPELSVLQAGSSSSPFPDEISSSANWIPVGSVNLKKFRSVKRKREDEKIQGFGTEIRENVRRSCRLEKKSGGNGRRVVRSGYGNGVGEGLKENEVSESSCVESFSGVNDRFLYNVVDQVSERSEIRASVDGDEASVEVSEASCIVAFPQHKNIWFSGESSKVSGEESSIKKPRNSIRNQRNEVAESSYFESPAESNVQVLCSIVGDQAPEIEKNYVESKFQAANSESTAYDQNHEELGGFDYFLACSENFSLDGGSDYSTINEMTLSEIESEIFPRIRDEEEFSESQTDFSELGESTPPTYSSFFLQYSEQLCKLSSSAILRGSKRVHEEYIESDSITFLRFEDELHEDSYSKFRCRERNQVAVHNYAKLYYSTADVAQYSDLVLQQRSLMINWIIERSNERELQSETTFLAVSLLDRFLSKGFFRNKLKLQLLGIASLTLATRLEENQPYNCVTQRTFHVGGIAYSRCEVVAMEWLLQESLDFQCFLPTIYNFLWFYLKAAKADAKVEKEAKYLARLCLLDVGRLRYWPSTVAAGLVMLATLAANQECSCQWVLNTHVRTKNDDLSQCLQSLGWLRKYLC